MPTDTVFPLDFDPPLVQNATYRFSPYDRQYIDSQIRALQRFLLNLPYVSFNTIALPDNDVTLSITDWLTDSTAGLILSGHLTATRVATVPTTSGRAFGRLVANTTSNVVTLLSSSSSMTIDTPPLAAQWIVFDGHAFWGAATYGVPIPAASVLTVTSAIAANVYQPFDTRNGALTLTAPNTLVNGQTISIEDIGPFGMVDINNATLVDPRGRQFRHPLNGNLVSSLVWGAGGAGGSDHLPSGFKLDMRLVTDGAGTQFWK